MVDWEQMDERGFTEQDEQQQKEETNGGILATNTNLVGHLVTTQFFNGSKGCLKRTDSELKKRTRAYIRTTQDFSGETFLSLHGTNMCTTTTSSRTKWRVVVDENPFGKKKKGTFPFRLFCTFENSRPATYDGSAQ